MALPVHDPDRIVLMLISLFNDVLIPIVHRRYVYAGDNINSNVGEPSKSYIQGQFYIDTEYNTLYLSYILDPNIIWNDAASAANIYDKLNDYIISQSRNNIDSSLKIELVTHENSILEQHEAKSKCRTEELTRYLYDDTAFLWTALDGQYRFVRDTTKVRHWKYKTFIEQGKSDFSDYNQEITLLNNSYDFKNDNSTLPIGFEVYKTIVKNYFDIDISIIEPSQVTRFYLLDFTDYSIKESYV